MFEENFLILGDILDKNLIRALIISEGDIRFFFESPLSTIIATVTFFTLFSKTPWFRTSVGAIKTLIRIKKK